ELRLEVEIAFVAGLLQMVARQRRCRLRLGAGLHGTALLRTFLLCCVLAVLLLLQPALLAHSRLTAFLAGSGRHAVSLFVWTKAKPYDAVAAMMFPMREERTQASCLASSMER